MTAAEDAPRAELDLAVELDKARQLARLLREGIEQEMSMVVIATSLEVLIDKLDDLQVEIDDRQDGVMAKARQAEATTPATAKPLRTPAQARKHAAKKRKAK